MDGSGCAAGSKLVLFFFVVVLVFLLLCVRVGYVMISFSPEVGSEVGSVDGSGCAAGSVSGSGSGFGPSFFAFTYGSNNDSACSGLLFSDKWRLLL